MINGDPRAAHRDRPQRAQWSGWDAPQLDRDRLVKECWEDPDQTFSQDVRFTAPWVKDDGKRYNFRSRKYEGPQKIARNAAKGQLWTDAHWPENAKRKDKFPLSFRDDYGLWHTRVPVRSGMFAGGRAGWPLKHREW